MHNKSKASVEQIAFLVTCAAALQIAENFLPRIPVPGIKLGLANLVTLIALTRFGVSAAIEVATIRTVTASLLTGTFLSPGFFISFTASTVSASLMGFIWMLGGRKSFKIFSLTGISILGAFLHNLTQLGVVYLIMIHNKAVFVLLPYLGISAVLTGFLTGVIASKVSEKLDAAEGRIYERPPVSGTADVINKKAAIIKIVSALVFSIAVIIVNDLRFYAACAVILFLAAALLKTGIKQVFRGIYRARYLLIFSAFIPILFNSSGEALYKLGILKLTKAGFDEGIVFTVRLMLLIGSAGLLTTAAKMDELAYGIEKILMPFRFIGLDAGRVSAIIACSWAGMPGIFERASAAAKSQFKTAEKSLNGLIDASAEVAVILYTNSEDKKI